MPSYALRWYGSEIKDFSTVAGSKEAALIDFSKQIGRELTLEEGDHVADCMMDEKFECESMRFTNHTIPVYFK